MGRLTTHVLDTARGIPGAGIRIELFDAGQVRRLLSQALTNQDGRCDTPLLEGSDFRPGIYELEFHAGEYFAAQTPAAERFLDVIVIRFQVSDASAHYHVPLLVSPFGYTTYRGS